MKVKEVLQIRRKLLASTRPMSNPKECRTREHIVFFMVDSEGERSCAKIIRRSRGVARVQRGAHQFTASWHRRGLEWSDSCVPRRGCG